MASGYLLQRKMSLNSTDSTQVRSTETLFSIPVNRSAFYCSAIQVNPEITPAIRISRYANPSLPLVTQIYFIPKYWIVAFRLFHTRSFIVYRVHGLVPSLSTLNNFICSWRIMVTILTSGWKKRLSFDGKLAYVFRLPWMSQPSSETEIYLRKNAQVLRIWASGRRFSCRNRKTSFHLFSST